MIFAKRALLPHGWGRDLRLTVSNGVISDLLENQSPQPGDHRVDTLLPALANLHSHAFQRAMAGRTEFRVAGQDSFWTWRDLMYRFTAHLTPQHVKAIAAMVFLEMQEAGFASVGEFHYLHHQPGGEGYEDPGELSTRIMAAAAQTGIGLTHLPVLYSYGGAGRAPLQPGQARFGCDLTRFERVIEAARRSVRDLPSDCQMGIAPHSLRATAPEDLARLLENHRGVPIHIHAAEQPREVREVSEWLGARPVEWLLDNAGVGPDWCLIHATHMTPTETETLARSGAVTGLCPITEANLGDGPFNGPAYLREGGAFGIGSDSNVRIALWEELRLLEYGQRLRDLARNVMVVGAGSVGATLYAAAARGGAQALGRPSGEIAAGALADLVAIDSTGPALSALPQQHLLDGLVFAAGEGTVTDLWSAGRHQVREGRHVAREPVTMAYRRTMSDLAALM